MQIISKDLAKLRREVKINKENFIRDNALKLHDYLKYSKDNISTKYNNIYLAGVEVLNDLLIKTLCKYDELYLNENDSLMMQFEHGVLLSHYESNDCDDCAFESALYDALDEIVDSSVPQDVFETRFIDILLQIIVETYFR